MAGAAKKAAGTRGGGKAAAPGRSVNAKPAKDAPPEERKRPFDPLRSGVRIEDLSGQELKDYAKGLYVPAHVIEALTEDRLRGECLLKLREILDSLDD